ncbi:tRNA (cytosine(49)-C(5))-methyltransferase [uncultured archaeon]|nr:tRNA (cytosine(49)-C(5))-methyltransferase [uncultured archaeon]
MGKTFIPEEFIEKYSRILGQESGEFFESCCRKIPKSIWVNSLKTSPKNLVGALEAKGWNLKGLFHENAFALEGTDRPGQSEEFRKGFFNLQEKASMIPALILNPLPEDLVLDACAAPGNKTLQLSCLMQGGGKIVAVDKNVKRFGSLCFNIRKFGTKNAIAKRMDLIDAWKKNLFDKILLDAPCSSEGLVRKDFDALRNWSQGLVMGKAELQKKLILKCFGLLKNGGTMVYSTCSLSPEEDEEVVQHLLESTAHSAKGGAEVLGIRVGGFRFREGLTEYNGGKFDESLRLCARVLPQDNDSEAFFIAKIRKK